jgi:hypothetical protein
VSEGEDSGGLWSPAAPEGVDNPFDAIDPAQDDIYLAVDEIEAGLVRLVIAAWPEVDAHGRLTFPSTESSDVDTSLPCRAIKN